MIEWLNRRIDMFWINYHAKQYAKTLQHKHYHKAKQLIEKYGYWC